MFSGIVEATSKLTQKLNLDQALRIWVQCPSQFNDLKIGDSISTNGVCLTVEEFTSETIQFCLGLETLSLLKKSIPFWEKIPLNLERSLKFGDRIHGHMVTGHVDSEAQITKTEKVGDVWLLHVKIPSSLKGQFWKKGSACVNGVSLTVNSIENDELSFCLIPETLKLTNLSHYQVGDWINLESDYLAKAFVQFQNSQHEKEISTSQPKTPHSSN